MVDMASFFMAALSCLLIINGSHKKAAWLLLALTLALALLTKPNLISLVLFFVFYAGRGKNTGRQCWLQLFHCRWLEGFISCSG